MSRDDANIASRINAYENDKLDYEWDNFKYEFYRSNSHKKPKVRRVSVRHNIIDSIIPSKDEIIFDILLPTIRRSIINALLQ